MKPNSGAYSIPFLTLVSLLSSAIIVSASSPASNLLIRCDTSFHCQPATFQNLNFGVPAATVYNDNLFNRTGWNGVKVTADPILMQSNPSLAFFAAGFAEGYATQYDIHVVWINLMVDTLADAASYNKSAFMTSMQQHYQYLTQNFTVNDTFKFERQVAKLMIMVKGVAAGYNASWLANGAIPAQQRTLFDIFLINMQPEIGEWMKGTINGVPNNRPHPHLFSQNSGKESLQNAKIEIDKDRFYDTRCSVLIKNTGSDLFVGHTTWWRYSSMYRQFKTYTLDNTTVSFSAYPGLISSMDDFYYTSRGLIVAETTLWVFNNTLYTDFITPYSIAEFLRVMGANFVSDTAQEWVSHFSTQNSGTYCSQYMALDVKLFVPGQAIVAPNTLWVAEQLPGNITSADVSFSLNSNGYWASYNTPYFADVDARSGDLQFRIDNNFTPDFGRIKIMAQQQATVVDLPTMQAAMRYNNYKVDPFSALPNCTGATNNVCQANVSQSAWFAISARGDLVPYYPNATVAKSVYGQNWAMFNGHISGGTDGKISSWSMMYGANGARQYNMSASIINGPSTSHGLPPFQWSLFAGPPFSVAARPLEHPDIFNFSWVSIVSGKQTNLPPMPTAAPGTAAPAKESSKMWVAPISAAAGAVGIVCVWTVYSILKRQAARKADIVSADDYVQFTPVATIQEAA